MFDANIFKVELTIRVVIKETAVTFHFRSTQMHLQANKKI